MSAIANNFTHHLYHYDHDDNDEDDDDNYDYNRFIVYLTIFPNDL